MKKRILLTTMILTLLIVFIPMLSAFADSYVVYGDGYVATTKNLWFVPSGGMIVLSILVTVVVGLCLKRWHTKKPSVQVYKKYMIGDFVLDYRHVRGRINVVEVVNFIERNLK